MIQLKNAQFDENLLTKINNELSVYDAAAAIHQSGIQIKNNIIKINDQKKYST